MERVLSALGAVGRRYFRNRRRGWSGRPVGGRRAGLRGRPVNRRRAGLRGRPVTEAGRGAFRDGWPRQVLRCHCCINFEVLRRLCGTRTMYAVRYANALCGLTQKRQYVSSSRRTTDTRGFRGLRSCDLREIVFGVELRFCAWAEVGLPRVGKNRFSAIRQNWPQLSGAPRETRKFSAQWHVRDEALDTSRFLRAPQACSAYSRAVK